MTGDPTAPDLPERDLPESEVPDDELTELALAADPESPVADDAVSLWELQGPGGPSLLPQWYMPAPAGGARQLRDWRRWVVPVVIGAFVLINAYGLCSTYGQVTFG